MTLAWNVCDHKEWERYHSPISKNLSKSDAHKIAAAPHMLEALEEILGLWPTGNKNHHL